MPLDAAEKTELTEAAHTVIWTALRFVRAVDHGSTVNQRTLAVLLAKQADELREQLAESVQD